MKTVYVLVAIAVVYSYARHIQFPLLRGGTGTGKNDVLCTLCEVLVDEITPYVDANNVTEEAYKICDSITDKNPYFDKLCKQFVDETIIKIADDIQDGKSAQEICSDDIGIC